MLRLPIVLVTSLLALVSFAHPLAEGSKGIVARTTGNSSDFDILFQGNQAFRKANPALLKDLAENGQHPPFLFIGCSDSRVSEGTVFEAPPGTMFAERNIANQYHAKDDNIHSILAYGVEELNVSHIIVMGHYGCGGIASSIASPPQLPWDDANAAIQEWIAPIRALYSTSQRAEIVTLRNANKGKPSVPAPELHDPGFRALVEENVKSNVKRIAADRIVTESFDASHVFFIHGWVYDIENGAIKDLGVSVGPPGQPIPSTPFPTT